MKEEQDIRWIQRFSNYRKALKKLNEAIDYIKINLIDNSNENFDKSKLTLNEIIKEGLIQRFEYTYEMAWNVMKDYALFQGNTQISGSRDAIRYSFSINIISEGDLWMDMVQSRIKTSHTYDEETVDDIYYKIINKYHLEFIKFEETMTAKIDGKQLNIYNSK